MPQLYHHPLDPQSRFIRLALAEYGIEPELIEEKVFERRHDFLALDPAGETPLLLTDDDLIVPGAPVIAEYLDETLGETLGAQRLLPPDPDARIEVRRLVAWFAQKFYGEVSNWLVTEKVYKRFMPSDAGGGAPDMELVRAARANIRY